MVCLEAGEIVPFPKKKKFVNLSPCPTNHSLKIPTYCMCIPDVYNSVMMCASWYYVCQCQIEISTTGCKGLAG